jgi:hypothetical protein
VVTERALGQAEEHGTHPNRKITPTNGTLESFVTGEGRDFSPSNT